MNLEDIKMGEWYRHGNTDGTTDEFTPLSLHCDSFTEMAFLERESGKIFLFSVFDMEPVPEPVVFMEQWMVMGSRGVRSIWDSLRDAEAVAKIAHPVRCHPVTIGIMHVRTDGTTEMLEVES